MRRGIGYRAIFWVIVSVWVLATTSERLAAQSIRVVTLNAEFLFDGRDGEGRATFPHKGDVAKAYQHLLDIGAVLREADGDVVMLAEIEHEGILDALIEGPLAGMGYRPYFVQGDDSFTGQDMGLLSRFPMSSIGRTDERVAVGDRTRGVSKNLYGRFEVGDDAFTIIGVHFLARPDDTSRKPEREGQAEVIRRLVAEETARGRHVIVAGDFNDFDSVVADVNQNMPITTVLETIKSAGEGPEDDLINVAAFMNPSQRYTAFWDRNRNGAIDAPDEFSSLDHILISKALQSAIDTVYMIQSYNPMEVTDHFPVIVSFTP